MFDHKINRRRFCKMSCALPLAALIPRPPLRADSSPFRLRYILASCMYGKMNLETVLAHAQKSRARYIDVWPAPHANHREQIDKLGHHNFLQMLRRHDIQVGILSRYDRSPFKLADEMPVAKSLGAQMIICSSRGPRDLQGPALKDAVKDFLESMKPHIALAQKHGLTIGIENHSHSLISSPDSIRWFAELAPPPGIGIALAPYHLPQDPQLIADLIATLDRRLVHFYAWQHGDGCMKKLPKDRELLQMPGRGPLDFKPILAALMNINYKGWTEIFMHPFPRGIPILPTADAVTLEIKRARMHLQYSLARHLTESQS